MRNRPLPALYVTHSPFVIVILVFVFPTGFASSFPSLCPLFSLLEIVLETSEDSFYYSRRAYV